MQLVPLQYLKQSGHNCLLKMKGRSGTSFQVCVTRRYIRQQFFCMKILWIYSLWYLLNAKIKGQGILCSRQLSTCSCFNKMKVKFYVNSFSVSLTHLTVLGRHLTCQLSRTFSGVEYQPQESSSTLSIWTESFTGESKILRFQNRF